MALPGVLSSVGLSASGQGMKKLLQLASDSNRVLVMIYLEGGNDGLNTVIPMNHLSALNDIRPDVVLPEESLMNLQQSQVALHPSLSNFKSLYSEGKLAVVQNVGYPQPNYSHFRSTDIWMSGSSSDELVTSGWAGRHLSEKHPEYPDQYPTDADPLAIELGFGASLLLQGPASSMGMVIQNPDSFYQLVDNVEQTAPDTPAGDKLKYIRLIAKQSQQFGEIVKEAASRVNNLATYPMEDDNDLADQLKIVSRLIAGGLSTPMYLVKIGGFDTHESQVVEGNHAIGNHANLLAQVDQAVSAFMKDLELLGTDDRVVGMTFSEFGRRPVSNASLGTDHGSAAPMFFFGNAVKGGVIGSNPLIDSSMTYEDNLTHEFDFRQLYASILEQWFGVSSETVASVLLGSFDTIEIIGESLVTGTPNPVENKLNVFPNPLNDQAFIELLADGQPLSMDLMDLQGRIVHRIYSGTLSAGKHTIQWNTSGVKKGHYFVIQKSQSGKRVVSVVK